QVLHHAHRVLLLREHEVAQGHHRADQAHVPEQPRDHRLALATRGDELDQPAAAEHRRAGQADQLPRRHVQPGPFQPDDRVVHEIAGGGREHHSISSTGATLPRRISQATPRRSLMPTSARWRLLYLDAPVARWRWFTGTLTVWYPARCISAGR